MATPRPGSRLPALSFSGLLVGAVASELVVLSGWRPPVLVGWAIIAVVIAASVGLMMEFWRSGTTD